MPKKKGGNKAEIDENVVNDTILITSEIFNNDTICREIIENCSENAIDLVHEKVQNEMERNQASKDILDGFIYFGKWCYMNKDLGEHDINKWKQEIEPERIMADSWSSSIIPIRKIIIKKEEIFDIKSKEITNSKTNSVRSGYSQKSKMSKASLRSKLKRSSINDIGNELKKPLKNIIDDGDSDEDDAGKVEIIQLNNNQSTNNSNLKTKTKSNKNKKKKGKNTNNKENAQNKENKLSINIKQTRNNNQSRQSLNIGGLKTGRLSMKSSNVYKYHPNKPFTYDHTGQKMTVSQIKPEKIPNNIVSPLVSFGGNEENEQDLKDKKMKSARGTKRGVTLQKKSRKKKSISKSKLKTTTQPIFKTNSVPVQPPIESIMKVESGVSLKTKTTTIKGTIHKKNKIENLSRTEYNQYIETLKHVTTTHVFDTNKPKYNPTKTEETEINTKDERDIDNNIADPVLSVDPGANVTNGNNVLSSPKSHRSPINQAQRMKHKSPKSIKQKRGQFYQKTDRMISEYNRNSLLPPINTNDKDNVLGSSSMKDLNGTMFSDKSEYGENRKYQRSFKVESPKPKIEKSKLGKTLFADK